MEVTLVDEGPCRVNACPGPCCWYVIEPFTMIIESPCIEKAGQLPEGETGVKTPQCSVKQVRTLLVAGGFHTVGETHSL